VCLAFTLPISGDAHADWPMNRHDRARTAATTGVSDLAKPVVAWRRYLGGALGADELVAEDVNKDGSVDLLLVSGGKLIAKRPNDAILWETPPLGLDAIRATADFNGDGILDIVASGSPGFVGIFSGRDGALQFRVDRATFGSTVGAVRVARLNGDALPDLYVADAACGSVGQTGEAAAYSFATGFGGGTDDGSRRLWRLEKGRQYVCGINDVVADLNNDGKAEIVAFASTQMYLYDGATGARIGSGGADPNGGFPLGFSVPYGVLRTALADVDGDGDDDIVGFTNNGYAPNINSRRAFAVTYDPSRPQGSQLYVRWSRGVENLETDRHAFIDAGAADLDGDGRAEVTTTLVTPSGSTTLVLDGATGVVRASIAGQTLQGIVRLAPAERPTVLLRDGANLKGYRFDSWGAVPPPAFVIPFGSLLSAHDRTRALRSSASTVVLAPVLDASDRRGLVLTRGTAVELWDPAAPANPKASYALPDGVTAIAAAPQTDVQNRGPGILLARSDGFLVVLDSGMRAINFGSSGEFQLPGVRTGGYYSGPSRLGTPPLAARFGDRHADVVALDSRGVLLRLDASAATLVRAPRDVWQWAGARRPILLDRNNDGAFDAVLAQVGSNRLVERLADGVTERANVDVGLATGGFGGDIVPLAGPSGTFFTVPYTLTGTGESTLVAFDSAGVRWSTTPIVTAGTGRGDVAVDDFDGDGVEDAVLMMAAHLRFYDGRNGALLTSGVPNYSALPITVRGRAGAVTHVAGASIYPAAGITLPRPVAAPQSAWTIEGQEQFFGHLGAVVPCASGLTYAGARFGGPTLTVVDVATGNVRYDLVVAGGRIFADEAAMRAARVLPGVLGNVSATPRLFGEQPAFVVGSTDGYLYAVDACSATPRVLWALNLRAPVGEPIFADTDGDGAEEIVLMAADGFLYGIDTELFPAPAEVLDTDPGQGVLDRDVDETRGTALGARWTEVPGALGYQYAVFTAAGTPVSRNPDDPANPFLATGPEVKSITFSRGLVSGTRYVVAVRAIGPKGASSETLSNGTTFVLDDAFVPGDPPRPEPDGGAPDSGADGGAPWPMNPPEDGCACRIGARGGPLPAGVAIATMVAMLAFAMRRTQRR
jgi:hypothetical protein